jgi:hypothetical protein
VLADGKVYVACGRDMHVFKTGRTCRPVSESRLPGEPATMEAGDGVAVLSMGKYLAAYVRAEELASAQERSTEEDNR